MPVIFKILVLLSAIMLSCEKGKDDHILKVSREHIEFPADGGSATIEIETDAHIWTIQNPVNEWVNLSSNTGTKDDSLVTLYAVSKTLVPRQDTLFIHAGNAIPVMLIVSQASSEYLYDLSVDMDTINFGKSGGTNSINLSTNATVWSLSSQADWIQLRQETSSTANDKIIITVSGNPEPVNRIGKITIKALSAQSIEITVIQEG